MPNKKGGYFVYKDVQDAIFADIVFHEGGLFTAPRTILKCICWGDKIAYGKKLCFSYILPVNDLGLPMGYKANGRECAELAIAERERRHNERLEVKHDLGLVRMNNFSLEQYENNCFENYFSASVVRRVELALLEDRVKAELAQDQDQGEADNGLSDLVSGIENKYR